MHMILQEYCIMSLHMTFDNNGTTNFQYLII